MLHSQLATGWLVSLCSGHGMLYAVFRKSSHFGSYDLRQESPHWKNRMSREGILYTVAHLGVDLAKEILFVP